MLVTSQVYCPGPISLIVHILQDAWGDAASIRDSQLVLAAFPLAPVSRGNEAAAAAALSVSSGTDTCRKPPASLCLFSHFGVIKLACQQEVVSFIAFFLSELLGDKTGRITLAISQKLTVWGSSDAEGVRFWWKVKAGTDSQRVFVYETITVVS